ncbi:CBU_0585 family protein [Candidatus Coxiella mudrowiae]|uniref:CBU_0585 family protein n=1 Tax=Candidatus Coxiella mudrowiae TaxID=2054173 RepID=UPI000C2837BD|nr:CBU_0585 family protein [Candidatus Coxiella mudrowiae]
MFRKKNNYQKTLGAYISEIDKRLIDFNQNHAWSATQVAEIKKYKRIFHLQNTRSPSVKRKTLWDFE